MHSGGSRILQLVEGAIYMLDQLSCVVGALHFGEIWNQLGEGGIKPPTVLTLAPPRPGHGTGIWIRHWYRSSLDLCVFFAKYMPIHHICLASLHVHKWFGNSKRRLNDYTYIKNGVLLCLRKSRFVYNSHRIDYSGLTTLFLFLWILTPASIQSLFLGILIASIQTE